MTGLEEKQINSHFTINSLAVVAAGGQNKTGLSPVSSCHPGGSEHAQNQLFRVLRYHTLQDPQLHDTLKDLLATVKVPSKGLSTAARLYLSRREFTLGGGSLSKHSYIDDAARHSQEHRNRAEDV